MAGDDEIAELEAKLEAMKRAKAEEAMAAEDAELPTEMTEVQDGFDFTTMSSRKKVAGPSITARTGFTAAGRIPSGS